MTSENDGRPDRLVEIAIAHERDLFRAAYAILHEPTQSEDAVQQTLLRACQTVTPPRNALGWLLTVVANESFLVLRRRQLERRAKLAVGQLPRGAQPPPVSQEVVETVRAAVGELPELTRAVVLLRVMLGYGGNEVAGLLELSASEVSRRLYAGLDKLRTRMRNQQDQLREECR